MKVKACSKNQNLFIVQQSITWFVHMGELGKPKCAKCVMWMWGNETANPGSFENHSIFYLQTK